MTELSQASNSINQGARKTTHTHWFGASYLFALLVLSIALQLGIKSELASSIAPSTVKTISGYTYSAILLFGFLALIGLLWSSTQRVIAFVQEAIDRAKKSKRELFFSELAALVSTAIRSILRAPRKFLYWLAGANSHLLYSKWHKPAAAKSASSDDCKEHSSKYLSVFSQTAIKAENVGLTLFAIGIYIFAVIAYLLSMVFQPQPIGGPQLKLSQAAIVSPATQSEVKPTNKNVDANQATTGNKTTESTLVNATLTTNGTTKHSGVTGGTATDSLGQQNGNPTPMMKADGSVSDKLKKIPFVGDILNKVVGHLELVVVCIAAFFAIAVILVDRSIYVDKTVERWLWDRRLSRTTSTQDKSGAYFTGFLDWGTFFIKVVLKYSPRVLLAVALSYFGAVAGELFFFQRDIDARLSQKLEEKVKDVRSRPERVPTSKHVLLAAQKSERDASSDLNKLTDNINLLKAVLDHERRPGIKVGAKTNPRVFSICLTSKYDPEGVLPIPRGTVKESDSGPGEGCPSDMFEHPVITNLNSTGAAGEGKQSKTRASELNELESKVRSIEAASIKAKEDLQTALSNYEGHVKNEAISELGANGFLRRIAVLEQL